MSIQSRIGSIPIFGYVLKVVHDIIMLPVMRAHLTEEVRALELRSVGRSEFSGEITAVEQRLSEEVWALERRSVRRGEFSAINYQLAAILDRITELTAAVDELRKLEQHADALAASARRAKRDQSDLSREVAGALERLAALEVRVTSTVEMLQSEIQSGLVEFEDHSVRSVGERSSASQGGR